MLMGGSASLQSYCYKMKTIQAFSWALFCAFVIAIIILFQLVHQAQRFGRWQIWSEPIRGLSWSYPCFFGEALAYSTFCRTSLVWGNAGIL
jgi:hypothetical protein